MSTACLRLALAMWHRRDRIAHA